MPVVRRAPPARLAGLVAVSAVGVFAAIEIPAVHAHSLAAPANTQPPSIVVAPGLGSHVTVTQGSWGGAPTSFSYQYLRCPDGGGAADGSSCTPLGAATTTPDLHLITPADAGHTLRVRETATNAGGSTSAVSASSGTAFNSEVNVLGCPPVQQAGATVQDLSPPAGFQIDRHTSSPAVITGSTQRLTLRVEVVACDDQAVRGALVYATPTPFQMFSEAESATDSTGWATLTLHRLRHFPATPHQQNFVVFLRARKPGDPLLGGISGRRLVSFPVRLPRASGALVAGVAVPAVHARSVAAPTNTAPPSLVVAPAVGSYLNATAGSWSGGPTSFTYQWLFCPGGGGPADGSGCTATTAPQPDAGTVLVEKAEIGSSFRVRVAATNADGSAGAVSDASPAVIEPDLSFITGCPPADQAGPVSIDTVVPPARLEIDGRASSPAVITGSTQRLTLRFHVVACDGKNVSGALVYATPAPFEQFAGPERATGADGWATITLAREQFFPATPRQQNLIVFVRARKAGEDLLGGISTRRLVSFRVRLR